MNAKKVNWRGFNSAFWVLMFALALTVLYKLGDSYVVNHLIDSKDKVVVSMVYLTLGASIGLMINFVLCQTPFGALIDESFASIRGMPVKAHRLALVSGILGALSTGVYLYSMTMLDPSLVVPLTSLAVVYISVAEALRGKISFRKVLPSLVLVLLGVGVASYVTVSENWQLLVPVLTMILLGHNVFNAVSEVISKDAIDASDSVSFNFWRFFWLTVSGIMISILMVFYLGKVDVYLSVLAETALSKEFFVFVSLLMVVVFFAQVLASRGVALSDATTKNIIMTGTIVFSVFATLLASALLPQYFELKNISNFDWLLRFVGAGLLTWGIVLVRKL